MAVAESLVRRGEASFLGEARQELRYLADYEQKRLRAEIFEATKTAIFDVTVANECKARIWRTTHSGRKRMPGGPRFGVKQFVQVKTNQQVALEKADG